jgi:nonsense-mediated mRNA decay protein 3
LKALIALTAPCYLCGEKSVIEGLCENCYNKENPLIGIKTPLSITTCKRCGSVKIPGGWKTLPTSIKSYDEQIQSQIDLLLSREVQRQIEGVVVSFEEKNRLDRVHHIIVTARGSSHADLDHHEENYPVEVRMSYGTCDTCGMLSGGYYEAILQVRADDRPLSEDEEESITALVEQRTIAEYGRDVKAFITGSDSDKYGVDFWVGSEHLARKIADEIQAEYLAERKENYKLYGQEKGGKDKFRVTLLLRLPRFTVGDFISVLDHPCQVTTMGKGGVSCHDLTDSSQFTVTPKSVKWKSMSFLAEESEKKEFVVVSRVHGQPVQLMDAKTFEMHEIESELLDDSVEAGTTIFGFQENENVYPLPAPKTTSE